MAKNKKQSFDFGELPDKVMKAADVLTIRSIIILDQPLIEWAEKTIREEEIRRLGIVARSYGLKISGDGDGVALALELARSYCKGFRVLSPRKGNPRNAGDEHSEIHFQVCHFMATKGSNLSEAISNVARRTKLSRDEVESRYHRGSRAVERDSQKITAAVHELMREG